MSVSAPHDPKLAKENLRAVRRPLRTSRFSTVFRPALLLTVLVLSVLLLALFCLDIAVGETTLPLGRVLDVLSGGGTRSQRFIVLDSRLPRALTAVVVGAALGLAGALTQSILHNPLASPDILGITSGAGLGAVAVVVGTGGAATGLLATVGTPLAALAGGLLTAVVIYLLAWGRSAAGERGASGLRLVLIGIGVNAFLLSAISYLLTRADLEEASRAQLWLTGSVSNTDTATLIPVAIVTGVLLVLAAGSARTLAVLRMDAETTRGLGVRIQTQQGLLIGTAVLAAAMATAVAGPIGFVALAAPQLARGLLRTPGEPVLASALVGAILVVGSDIVARTLVPVDLPVGIVTAALGGPFLLLLLVRMNRKATVS